MNILFLTSSSYSHIICLKNVIKHLVNRKETIFCMSTPENQKILEEFGAKFISYPDSIIPVSIRKEIKLKDIYGNKIADTLVKKEL